MARAGFASVVAEPIRLQVELEGQQLVVGEDARGVGQAMVDLAPRRLAVAACQEAADQQADEGRERMR